MFRSRNREFDYPLLKAIDADELETVKSLLTIPQITCALDDKNNGVLHHAVNVKNSKMIELLLKEGADISKENNDGKTPIQLAADKKLWKCVTVFAKNRKATDNKGGYDYALLKAVEFKKLKVAENLLEAGAKTTCIGDNNKGVLHYAVGNGKPDMIALLLKYGADISKENDYKKTPIQIVTDSKSWNCVTAFAKNRKDTNNKGGYDYALIRAVDGNLLDVAKDLLEAGAKTTGTLYNNKGVLHCAVKNGNPDMIALLLKYHADISKKDDDKKTAVQLAADLATGKRDKKLWECVQVFSDHHAKASYFFTKLEAKIIIIHLLLFQRNENNIFFSKLPLEIINHICSFIPVLSYINIKELSQEFYLSSAKVFCHKYKTFWSTPSETSKKFVADSEKILESKEDSTEEKCKKISKTVDVFVKEKGSEKSRAVNLLIKYHLITELNQFQDQPQIQNSKNDGDTLSERSNNQIATTGN